MTNSEDSIARVLALVEERGLTHVQMGVFDAMGRLCAKRYHVRNLKKAMTEGTAYFSGAVSILDPRWDPIGTNAFFDPVNQFRDGILRLDSESCRDFPLEADGRGLLLIGQFVDETQAHCSRSRLTTEIDRLAALGFAAYGALELEAAVLNETAESLQKKTPETVELREDFGKVYSFVHQVGSADLLDGLLDVCNAMGVGIDTLHAEYRYMMEVGLSPELGVRIADNAALYKSIAKIVGRQNDALVTFMARRSGTEQGCGAHVNISLRDLDTGEGVFFDADADDRMSATMKQFIAGLHHYLPDLFLLLAPNFNSYRRFQPGLFTPLNNSWGVNNKTVAFRAINLSPSAARVEVRPSGADINPYLALTAVLAAGRKGIEEELRPPEPIVGDGWSVDPSGPKFPLVFAEAIDRFENSKVAREVLGGDFVAGFVSDRRWQLDLFDRTVTDWELHMFAEGV